MSAFGQLLGIRARLRTIGNRPEQAKRGAPGLDRTADTRFRKPQEAVLARGASCAFVLHSPRFRAVLVVGRAQACWAVVRRLVGRLSAARVRRDARATTP